MTLFEAISVKDVLAGLEAAEAAVVTLRAVLPHLSDDERETTARTLETITKLAHDFEHLAAKEQPAAKKPTHDQRIAQMMNKLVTDEALTSQEGVYKPWVVGAISDSISTDADWAKPILKKYVGAYVDRAMTTRFAASRGLSFMGADHLVSKETLKVQIARLAERFDNWVEHAGDRHLKLTAMRRGDLWLAAEEREKRGLTELRIAALLRRLADSLTADQTVGDVYTTEQIAHIAQRLEVIYTTVDEPTSADDHQAE